MLYYSVISFRFKCFANSQKTRVIPRGEITQQKQLRTGNRETDGASKTWLLASEWKPTVNPSHKMEVNYVEDFGFETL